MNIDGQSLTVKTRLPWKTITSQAGYILVKMYIFASRIPPKTQALNETYFTTVVLRKLLNAAC